MASIEFFGEHFELRGKAPQYAMMKFARAVRKGADGSDIEGMAALLDLIQKCLKAEEWERFDKVADDNDPSETELTEIVVQTFQALAGRPTGLPSDSSDGQTSTPLKSVPSVDDKGSRFDSRPDLAIAVGGRRSA